MQPLNLAVKAEIKGREYKRSEKATHGLASSRNPASQGRCAQANAILRRLPVLHAVCCPTHNKIGKRQNQTAEGRCSTDEISRSHILWKDARNFINKETIHERMLHNKESNPFWT